MSHIIWFYCSFSLLFISRALHLIIDIFIPLFRFTAFSVNGHTTFIGMHSFYAIAIIGLGITNIYLLKVFPVIFTDNFLISLYIGLGTLLLIGATMFLGAKPPVVTIVLFLVFLSLGLFNAN